jgi:HEAT repeats
MRVSNRILRLTSALLREGNAVAAAQALHGLPDRAALEALVEQVHRPHSARTALAALDSLEGRTEPIVTDALLAALESPHSSVRVVSLQALTGLIVPRAARLFRQHLVEDESWMVRRAALRALAALPGPQRWDILAATTDPHWRVRHALIQVLLEWGSANPLFVSPLRLGEGEEDPTPQPPPRSGEGEKKDLLPLSASGRGLGGGVTSEPLRVEGLRRYLHYRWTGLVPEGSDLLPPEEPVHQAPFWDWDVAVLARNLERLGEAGRRQFLDLMPALLAHPDERPRVLPLETLRAWGEPRQLAEVVSLLGEPRLGTVEPVMRLLSNIGLDRVEAVTLLILQSSEPSAVQLAWVLDQVGPVLPHEEAPGLLVLFDDVASRPSRVRAALARLASRWDHPQAETRLRVLLDDPDPEVQIDALRGLARLNLSLDRSTLTGLFRSELPALRAEAVRIHLARGEDARLVEPLVEDPDLSVRVALAEALLCREGTAGSPLLARLQTDRHPHVRAAALTPDLAVALVADPDRETSWHVLARAARLRRVPLWDLEPEEPWRPEETPALPATALPLNRPPLAEFRPLGPAALPVSRLGVSGHYGLPVDGFVRAAAAGVNLFFWEPNYQSLTEFATRLSPSNRNALHFLAGSFEADGQRVRKDVERALRALKLERLAVFLVFWVQTWDRVTLDVRETLEQLKEEGKLASFGLSTHSRPLALDAMDAGWNPLMVRHSAAHRGAEKLIFPRALDRGTSLITFNNTCYGRLLRPQGDLPPPRASDCYRYTLSFPVVSACFSAPATLEQLEENLSALSDPTLPTDRRKRLLAQGERVYEEDTVFRKLIRAL